MTAILASVRNLREAEIALDAGVDFLDLKEPRNGALGALEATVAARIVEHVNGRKTVSATIGDLPFEAGVLRAAIDRSAATGADILKVGVFGGAAVLQSAIGLAALQFLARYCNLGHRIVLVLFAEDFPAIPPSPLGGEGAIDFHRLASLGITGIMLDTCNKTTGSLIEKLPIHVLKEFVDGARNAKLLTGLAGSLRVQDIEPLLELNADYLGFRGALCRNGQRGAELDPEAVCYCATAVTCTRLSEKLGA